MKAGAWVSYLALAAAMAIVGAYVGFSKALVIVFPVFILAWLRFAIAAVAMAPWLRRPADEAPLDRRSHGLLFLESFFGNFLFSICMLFGMTHSSALAAGVIMAAIPAVVALLSWLILGERVRLARRRRHRLRHRRHRPRLAGPRRGRRARQRLAARQPLLFGAVTCEALYVVLGKKLSASIGPKRISALINLWGLALVTPLALWQLPGFAYAFIPPSSWVLLVVYAIAASVVDRLAVDDRAQARCRLGGRRLHGVPADQRRAVGDAGLSASTLRGVQIAAFALALVGVVLATFPGRGRGRCRGLAGPADLKDRALALARQRHAVADRHAWPRRCARRHAAWR